MPDCTQLTQERSWLPQRGQAFNPANKGHPAPEHRPSPAAAVNPDPGLGLSAGTEALPCSFPGKSVHFAFSHETAGFSRWTFSPHGYKLPSTESYFQEKKEVFTLWTHTAGRHELASQHQANLPRISSAHLINVLQSLQ